MAAVVAAIGALAALAGMVGILSPTTMRRLNENFRSTTALYALALVRLTVGTVLFLAGPYCHHETPWVAWVVRAVGIFGIAVAIYMLLLGPNRLRPMIERWIARPDGFYRGVSLFLLLVGGFLVYAGT